MARFFRAGAMALAVLVLGVTPALGLMIAMRTPAQRAVAADVIVVGKVTAIEKELVEAPPFPDAPNKVAHKIAVVKIETNLAGAANTTHVKIAFVPPRPASPAPVAPAPPPPGRAARPVRGPLPARELKEGQEMLFFLTKHPSADFYVMPPMSPPLELKDEAGKKQLEAVTKITEMLADPMKGLKSDKQVVRIETAAIMVLKYRSFPEFARDAKEVPINADESRLILQALAEAEWAQNLRPAPGADLMPTPYMAFLTLGLTESDGWKQPVVPKAQPGQPAPDFVAIQKAAFTNWLAGPGKNYVVKRFVGKK